MMTTNRSIVMTVLVSAALSSQVAFAQVRALTGEYVLSSSCEISNGFFGNVTLPAGKIIVSENIPVSSGPMGSDVHPGIILQAGDEFQPVLSLGIGTVAFFQFGPEPTSVGKYADNGSTFVEQFTSAGASSVDGTLVLEKTADGLKISSVDASNAKASCSLSAVR